MEPITSTQNPKIRALLKLQKRKERDETSLFLIEGYRELSRALIGGVLLKQLFFCPSLFLGENEGALIEEARARGAEVIEVAHAPFEKISYRDRPDGLIGVGVMMRSTLEHIVFKDARRPFLLIAEAIEKPGNLGSILRSSDAAGVDGVLVCDRCTDIYNPNVVRSSVGTLFTQPVVELTSEEALQFLRAHGIQVVAATPAAELEFTKVDLRGSVALAVGTEQLGLSQKWLDAADLLVRIPMMGIADSLNVSAATTLLLYEVQRQRVL